MGYEEKIILRATHMSMILLCIRFLLDTRLLLGIHSLLGIRLILGIFVVTHVKATTCAMTPGRL